MYFLIILAILFSDGIGGEVGGTVIVLNLKHLFSSKILSYFGLVLNLLLMGVNKVFMIEIVSDRDGLEVT